MFRVSAGDGKEGLQLHSTFKYEDEGDRYKFDDLMKRFKDYCTSMRKGPFKRHLFFTRSQKADETIDQYATNLKRRAKTCELGELKDLSGIELCAILRVIC
ncbi:hypothetical protein HOLleu_25636 [Holothuria leucospilota]|uniref:Retrotransposon gag domain-containing protein n=1 Tax=Holothuria leucospilota TaxID=206669 RepID=A0A9Q1BT39_HOLLE|nr:hypothetical protein HOLleu_25636 [Holothuria leucospilota]